MYRVTENRNGEIILLAIFKYYDEAKNYAKEQMSRQIYFHNDVKEIKVFNRYKIEPIDIENIT